MEILEKLLEKGATVDFQDRVSKRAGIGWEVGGGSSTNKLPLLANLCQPGTQTGCLRVSPTLCDLVQAYLLPELPL